MRIVYQLFSYVLLGFFVFALCDAAYTGKPQTFGHGILATIGFIAFLSMAVGAQVGGED